jgi:RND family efflux transporter MFP subunit
MMDIYPRKLTRLAGFLLPLMVIKPALSLETDQYECLVEPYQVVKISSPIKGLIENVHVDTSDVVEQGQVLVGLESSVEKATVEAARARTKMTGEIRAREADLAFKKRQANRMKGLYAKKAVSSHEKDQAETNVTLATMELRKAREANTFAGLELKRAEAIMNERSITSPISGVVVERMMNAGEFVREEPILSIAQLNPLRIEVILPSSKFGSIKPESTASVLLESPVGKTVAAKVTKVDRVIDAASGTFVVRLEIDNPDYKLPGGLKCKADFSAALTMKN